MLKARDFLIKKQGFSLVEILVVLGIGGIVLAATSQFLLNQEKMRQKAQSTIEMQSLWQEFMMNLSNEGSCKKTFVGKPAVVAGFSSLTLKNKDGVVMMTLNAGEVLRGFTVETMQFTSATDLAIIDKDGIDVIGGGQTTEKSVEFEIVLARNGSNVKETRKTKFRVTANAAGVIQSCNSLTNVNAKRSCDGLNGDTSAGDCASVELEGGLAVNDRIVTKAGKFDFTDGDIIITNANNVNSVFVADAPPNGTEDTNFESKNLTLLESPINSLSETSIMNIDEIQAIGPGGNGLGTFEARDGGAGPGKIMIRNNSLNIGGIQRQFASEDCTQHGNDVFLAGFCPNGKPLCVIGCFNSSVYTKTAPGTKDCSGSPGSACNGSDPQVRWN